MKIESADVRMAGSGSFFKSHSREESLKVWVGDRRPDFNGDPAAGMIAGFESNLLEISEEARVLLEKGWKPAEAAPEEEPEIFELSVQDKLKITLVERMLESLTGKKFRFFVMEKLKLKETPDCRIILRAGNA